MKTHINKPILIISNYDDLKNPAYGGGGAYVIHQIAKGLSQHYSVQVITGKYPNSKNEIIDSIDYKRIGVGNINPQLGQIVFYFLLFFYIRISTFDIWMENFTPPFSTNFLQLFTKKPVIALVYMLVGEDMKRKYKLPFDKIERLGIKTYKYFIAPTISAKEKILAINSQANISVISNGIESKIFQNDKKMTKKYLLFLGRIEVNQKGLDLLVNAYSLIEKNCPYDLIIAGSGITSEENKLKEMIKSLHLEKRIHLVGRVDGKIKEKLLSEALLLTIASRFETFSVVALEALAYGIPAVSFNIEGLRWIPKNARKIAESTTNESLASAIKEVISNQFLRESIIEEGQKYARKHTWETIQQDYIQTIENIRKDCINK